jgi:hypothetical protein
MFAPIFPPVFSRVLSSAAVALAILAAAAGGQSATASTVIAYWDQNSNSLPGGGFGFVDGAFPQAASQGSGTLTVGGGLFEDTIVNENDDTVYQWVQSFSGSTVNAQPEISGGGSISPQGGTDNENNGGYFQFAFSMAGLTDLDIGYATRGTSTGFKSQTWSWSTDGTTFTDFQLVDSITTSSTFDLKQFSGPADLNNEATAFLRVTFAGATASTGNNRLDNITFSAVPEPSSIVLAGLGGLVAAGGYAARRRRGSLSQTT